MNRWSSIPSHPLFLYEEDTNRLPLMWFLVSSGTRQSQPQPNMPLNLLENWVRLLIHDFLIGSWVQFKELSSCCFLPVRSDYLRSFTDISGLFFFFTQLFSISPSLMPSSPTLPSVFLVTVYPVEGSGNTNRLSLPCGFSSSSPPLSPLLFLSFSIPYFPSSLSRGCPPPFLTAS